MQMHRKTSSTSVKLSPKFQVVIPRDVRRDMKLRPGQRFEVFEDDGLILLVPVRSMKEMRGFLRGIDTDVQRDKERGN
jgi:AbrB family looped-hinge helix DNA binding protein